MKLIILTFALLFSTVAFSQTAPAKDAYWVVETNKANKKEAIVYYYSADHQLIHKEVVTNRKVKATRRSHQAILNDSLQIALERRKAEDKAKTVKL